MSRVHITLRSKANDWALPLALAVAASIVVTVIAVVFVVVRHTT